jgi:hypothetical protein
MRHFSWIVVSWVVLNGLSFTASAAEECDPADLKDTTIYSQDIRTNILYAQETQKNQQLTGNSNGGMNILGYANLTGGEQANYLQTLSEQMNVNVQTTDKRYLYVSAMDQSARQMYKDCLENSYKNIYILPSENSATSDEFSVEAQLRNYPTDVAIPILITVTAGKVQEAPAPGWTINEEHTQLTGKLRAGSSVFVKIKRDRKLPFEMIVAAGSENVQNEIMTLPADADVKLIEEVRYSAVFTTGCNRCNAAGPSSGAFSLNLPVDEIIIPGSEETVARTKGLGAHMSFATGAVYPLSTEAQKVAYSAKYRPHDINVAIGTGVDGAAGVRNWCGTGYLSLKVLVRVPSTDNSSGRELPQPSLGC